jgi:hypothetical protein
MRRTRIAAATVMVAAGLIGAVAAPATAGKTRTLVGAFDQEPGSSVSMQVKLNNKGRPKFVKHIVFSGLSLLCDYDESNIPTPRKSDPLELPRLRVTYDGYGKRFENFDDDLSHFTFGGELLRKGKQAVGKVETLAGSRCSGLGYFLAKKE